MYAFIQMHLKKCLLARQLQDIIYNLSRSRHRQKTDSIFLAKSGFLGWEFQLIVSQMVEIFIHMCNTLQLYSNLGFVWVFWTICHSIVADITWPKGSPLSGLPKLIWNSPKLIWVEMLSSGRSFCWSLSRCRVILQIFSRWEPEEQQDDSPLLFLGTAKV